MRKNKNLGGKIIIGLISIFLGIVISMQFKTVKTAAEEKNLDVQRSRDETLQSQIKEKDKEIQTLKDTLQEYQNIAIENDKLLEFELNKSKAYSGMLKVKGKGIIITLSDGVPTEVGKTENYLIHDSDVLLLVNELKTLGAEAISVNDQRIAPNTDIRCAGATILVNSEKVIPPLTIKAIGNPDELESGLKMPGGVYNSFASFLKMSIEKVDEMTINEYKKAITFKYAIPVPKEEEKK